jgi:pilus assembly protein CpaB
MRTKPIITTLFIGSLVAVAVAGTHMLTQKSDSGEPKAYILATTVPLSQGTLLREQDVTWQGVAETKPGQFVRPSASQLEAKPELENQIRAGVYGAVLRHELPAGAPIIKDAIVKPGERDFLQVVLTPGERAIAIPVSTGGASTGLLSPGDHVDVILTQNFSHDTAQDMKNTPVTRRSVSETVVENLRVLAIDSLDTKPVGGNNLVNPATGNFGRTVTLEVTAEQAEQINVAAELGKLSLTLRSTNDFASAAPSASPAYPPILSTAHEPVDGARVKATWAGDVSPALSGAAAEKPVAVIKPTVTILRGFKSQSGGKERTEPEIVKTDE